MATPYETHVLVEIEHIKAPDSTLKRQIIKRILRSYLDKTAGEEAMSLLRDAFEPEHERQFDLMTILHVE